MFRSIDWNQYVAVNQRFADAVVAGAHTDHPVVLAQDYYFALVPPIILWWALAQVGEKARARELFELVLNKRNHLGLLSEDVVPETGEQWGNLPQTYSMVGLIQCAARLSKSWDEAY